MICSKELAHGTAYFLTAESNPRMANPFRGCVDDDAQLLTVAEGFGPTDHIFNELQWRSGVTLTNTVAIAFGAIDPWRFRCVSP
jgi:hypothetical protein